MRGSQVLHANFVEVKRLWEETSATADQIGAMYGVSHGTVSGFVSRNKFNSANRKGFVRDHARTLARMEVERQKQRERQSAITAFESDTGEFRTFDQRINALHKAMDQCLAQ